MREPKASLKRQKVPSAAAALKQAHRHKLEDAFEVRWKQLGLPPLVKEHQFHPTRKWRFDFAILDRKIAIEIDGGTNSRKTTRHTSGEGYRGDCVKLNEAARLGWACYRFTSDMVNDDSAVLYMGDVLRERGIIK